MQGKMADSDTADMVQVSKRTGRMGSKKKMGLSARISGEQNHRCAYCGIVFGGGDAAFSLDHFVTRAAGGSNDYDNLVGACFRCNAMRRDEDAMSFFERQGWLGRPWHLPVLLTTPALEWSIRTLADVWPRKASQ